MACTSEPEAPHTPEAKPLMELPAHFPSPVYTFSNNPLTEEGFQLGRKLFYDKRLSRTGTISCGSCHKQSHAFADPGMPVSAGVDGLMGLRNSPALFNLAWMPHFMWDGGVNHIDVMPVAPLTEPVEMDNDLPTLMAYLNSETEYPAEFEAVFGESQVTTPRVLWALAQFQGSMVSAGSKYDKFIEGRVSLAANEQRGMAVFEQHCSSCHQPPLFTDHSFRNNGLGGLHPEEQGHMTITKDSADYGKFKVPSLRNVALTYPYMHNGSLMSLEAVIEHYSEGIEPLANLDPVLSDPLYLSEEDKADLLDFLQTLTDFDFIGHPRFSDPFE